MKTITRSEILELGFLKFQDEPILESFTVSTANNVTDNSIQWLKSVSNYHLFSKGALILSEQDYLQLSLTESLNQNITHLTTSDRTPRLAFIIILNKLIPDIDRTNYVYEHRLSVKNVTILDNVYIAKNVTIGEGTIIYPNVVIHSNVQIGKNCIIKENSCLGTDGMGFEKDLNGEWIKFSQIGGLIIKNNVEIGSHSDIKRAALSNTIIEENCKIGSYTNIGHNCIIGRNSIFTAHCVIAGSNNIGDNFYMGINSSIRNGMKICNNVTLGANSYINKNIEEAGTYLGIPATLIKK